MRKRGCFSMLTLLAKLFIPNRKDLSDPKVHRAYGFLCSCLAIFLNLVLVVSKLLAAHFSRAASIRADATALRIACSRFVVIPEPSPSCSNLL